MFRTTSVAVLLALPHVTLGQAAGERMPPVYRNVPQRLTATVAGRLLDERSGRPITGALVAARWLDRRRGWYSMTDVLGL